MDAVAALTSNIQHIVRFIASINELFCQVRWLDANINNSGNGLLAICLAVVLFCAYLTFFSDSPLPLGLDQFITKKGALVLVFVLLGGFLYKRYRRSERQRREQSANTSLDGVMFGRVDNDDDGAVNEEEAGRSQVTSTFRSSNNNELPIVSAHAVSEVEMQMQTAKR